MARRGGESNQRRSSRSVGPLRAWWLNLDTLRPGTVDHHDIVEANDGKDSVVPALSREAFENLPETVKPLLRYSVAW